MSFYLIQMNAVFPLKGAPDACLISKHEGLVLIGGRRLKEKGAYFKRNYNFVIFSYQIIIRNYHYDI